MISITSELWSAWYRDSLRCHHRNSALPTVQMILCGCRMCIAGVIGSCNLVLVAGIAVATTSLDDGIHSENSKLSYCKPICGFVPLLSVTFLRKEAAFVAR